MNPFYSLPPLRLEENVGSFSIVSRALEKDFPNQANLRALVPHFSQWMYQWDLSGIRQRFAKVKGPLVMQLDSASELERHVLQIYQVAEANYQLSKQHRLPGFPAGYCGHASRNVALSLVEHGYVNAVFVVNYCLDHAYVILPFIMREKEGVIIVDPTSDQLFQESLGLDNAARNLVWVNFARIWEYVTDWKNGKNLFPTDYFGINQFKLPYTELKNEDYQTGIKKMLKLAYNNPVKVEMSK